MVQARETAGALTGRYLVLLPEDDHEAGMNLLQETAQVEVLSSVGIEAASDPEASHGVFYESLGVAVLPAPPPERIEALGIAAADASQPILAVEPERVLVAISAPAVVGPPWQDDASETWGMHATGLHPTGFDGSGVRVAILDTGIDLGHADFAGRPIVTESFVPGEAVDDGNGHGTHCAGIACGTRTPATEPRYGAASAAALHVGKVLSNRGRGGDGGIIAGISWALEHRCDVISMSLGAPQQFGAPHSPVYEQIAQRALARGTVIFAAAGNDNQRAAGIPAPVGRPANCPSIFAVAAIDGRAEVADFSNESDPNGGTAAQVDIAGPGVDVHSSWPRPTDYRSISGTSMATPFVAGIAALHAQATGLRGSALARAVIGSAASLTPLSPADVGSGLVQAP